MDIKTLAATALFISAGSAMAQPLTPVSGMKDTVLAGGGAYNFTMKPQDGVTYAPNYCIPYAAVNGNTPRGGADAINGWVNTVNVHHSLSFVDAGPADPQVCATPGSHLAQAIGSND
jgi:hypothetical protein